MVVDCYRRRDEPDRASVGYIKYACIVNDMFTIHLAEFIFYCVFIRFLLGNALDSYF